ncbi:MAG TPA: GWxTD domain-containing protein [Gemmatimonadales bacterium]|nr:GWxTD domain-containing protein [Gemmatimonadales bacterium]
MIAGAALLLQLALAAPPAAPVDRAELERFVATLAALRDAAALRAREAALGRRDAEGAQELRRRMFRGLVRLRLGELGDGWAFRRANGDFDAVIALAPGWAWAWYAKGLAKQHEARWLAATPSNLGTRVGMGSLAEAVACLARAAELDAGSTPAIVALAEVAETLRDTALLATRVLPVLRAAGRATLHPAVELARARLERLVGDPDSSVRAASRYLERSADSARGLYERAWSRFVAGDAGGDADYYAGAAFDDSATVAAYRADLALIATDPELAAFDTTRGGARAAFLRQFWSGRDRWDLREDGARLREHYRRLTYADRHFPLLTNRRRDHWTDLLPTRTTRFDDRGLVYVRFGEPQLRVSTATFGAGPNESWRYQRADGDLLLHFGSRKGGGGDLQDYRLKPSVFALPFESETALDLGVNARCPLYDGYCKILHWGPHGAARLAREERELVAASASVAANSEGFELRFPRTIGATVTAYAIGRAEGKPLVHVVYAVPVEPPAGAPPGAGLRLALRARVGIFDSAGRAVAAADSTTRVVLPPPEADRLDATGRVSLPVLPGAYRYRVALQVGDSAGRVLPLEDLRVPGSGAGPALSDLALGVRSRSAIWSPAPGDTAFLAPAPSFRAEEPVELYYEVYGLAPGEPYRTRLTIRRGRSRVSTTATEGEAADSVVRVTRTLSLIGLRPGRHTLDVEIASGTRRAIARRTFTVLAPRGPR